jgi:tetratricopeptide (TPR) repeat protein
VIRFAAIALLLVAQQPETVSLLDVPLYAPSLPKDERKKAEADWAQAYQAYKQNPSDATTALALGRANLALGRVGDALEVLTRGIETKPDDPELLAERGRGYIVIRKFAVAERDLRKAAASVPAARCSLALTLYLQANFVAARNAYKSCENPGPLAALAERRASPATASAQAAAAIQKSGDTKSSIESRYVDAVERLLAGDADAAREQFQKIVEKDRKKGWMEEIYIAAEADYARLYKPERRKKKL